MFGVQGSRECWGKQGEGPGREPGKVLTGERNWSASCQRELETLRGGELGQALISGGQTGSEKTRS